MLTLHIHRQQSRQTARSFFPTVKPGRGKDFPQMVQLKLTEEEALGLRGVNGLGIRLGQDRDGWRQWDCANA